MPTSIGLRWYQTGTVSVTQGSTTLVGVGTNWAGAGIKAGDIFTIDNSTLYEVLTVNSNESITLATAFAGVTGETLNYSIIRNFAATMQAEIAAQVALLVNKYETYIDTELETITGPKGDPGIVYKGVWAAERNYNAMDAVVYNNVLYLAKVPHISSAENAPGSLGSVWVDTLVTVPPVVNDLTTGGATSALSAEMGKTLENTKFNSSAAGDMTLLNTTAKSTFVSAINEVLGDVGNKATLQTTEKSSLVGAMNETFKKISYRAEIHVATNGNDTTGDGTSVHPFATINRAMAELGDVCIRCIIRIHAGEYNWTPSTWYGSSGFPIDCAYKIGEIVLITDGGDVTININDTVAGNGAYTRGGIKVDGPLLLRIYDLKINYSGVSFQDSYPNFCYVTHNGNVRFEGPTGKNEITINRKDCRCFAVVSGGTLTWIGGTSKVGFIPIEGSNYVGIDAFSGSYVHIGYQLLKKGEGFCPPVTGNIVENSVLLFRSGFSWEATGTENNIRSTGGLVSIGNNILES